VSNNETTFQHMQPNELQEILNSTATEVTPVIVDIRDENSFNASHISNAILLTNESLPEFIRNADMDAPVVVCCYHGISSQQAAQFLISQDFTDVYSLDGGFTQWQMLYPESVQS
jgi:thiosulfate sulfurtransferase